MHPDHLKQLVALAQKKKVPIIADEVSLSLIPLHRLEPLD
jgi:aspartate/methionine/tyrosine aminotransferase